MTRRALAVLALLPFLTGCPISFNNWVRVSVAPEAGIHERLFAIAEAVAADHHLEKDRSQSRPPEKQGYFGRRYHYYLFEIREKDGRTVAVFVHQAMMSGRRARRDEPERDFLKRVTTEFGSRWVEYDVGGHAP